MREPLHGQKPRFQAYVSEPITKCPPREKGRIKNLVAKITKELSVEPYYLKLYVPSQVTSPEVRNDMKPEHVYLLDRIRVVEADFMLVIADQTSFGIGGEVEMATSLGKPIIIISRDASLSRFLVGTPANAVSALFPDQNFIKYRDWRDLKPQLLEVLDEVIKGLRLSKSTYSAFRDVGKNIRKLRLEQGLSVEELASKSGLQVAQLRILEQPFEEIRRELAAYGDLDLASLQLDPYQLEQLTHIGLAGLERLAQVLHTGVAAILGTMATPLKDPQKTARSLLQQIEQSLLESLQGRAAQFDISYREFAALRHQLVDRVLERLGGGPPPKIRDFQTITEQDFLDALQQVRGLDKF